MNNKEIDIYLTKNGIKPTANRILVIRQLMEVPHPTSLSDLEDMLDTLDKSSIFRVLELLEEKGMVHVIEDGSRSQKYELCRNLGHHESTDEHVHFHCERCGATLCLDTVSVPEVTVPSGFLVRSSNYVLKGLCPSCSLHQDR